MFIFFLLSHLVYGGFKEVVQQVACFSQGAGADHYRGVHWVQLILQEKGKTRHHLRPPDTSHSWTARRQRCVCVCVCVRECLYLGLLYLYDGGLTVRKAVIDVVYIGIQHLNLLINFLKEAVLCFWPLPLCHQYLPFMRQGFLLDRQLLSLLTRQKHERTEKKVKILYILSTITTKQRGRTVLTHFGFSFQPLSQWCEPKKLLMN